MNYLSIGLTGACCLCTIILNNKLYTANIGDCEGILLSKGGEGEPAGLSYQYLNEKHAASNQKERERLRKEFPDDEKIVVNRKPDDPDSDSWYVKVSNL